MDSEYRTLLEQLNQLSEQLTLMQRWFEGQTESAFAAPYPSPGAGLERGRQERGPQWQYERLLAFGVQTNLVVLFPCFSDPAAPRLHPGESMKLQRNPS